MKISLWRRKALRVVDGAFSHRVHYVMNFMEILILEGDPNCITGSRVREIFLNGRILPGEVS